MNRALVQGSTFCQACVRRFSTSEIKNIKPDLTKIKRKQAEFQVDNDIPVYIKGGASDKVVYYFTVSLTVGGVLLSCNALYNMANKK